MEIFVPGRTEIIGNHTDHQQGRAIAAAVGLGITASFEALPGSTARVRSDGRRAMYVDFSRLEPLEREKRTSAGLIRGVACAMKRRGHAVGGFTAELRSSLRSGGGLSSSAAFCVLIGRILSLLYNGGEIDPVTLARCAMEAENIHFGKPSGLMDQLACAIGRPVYIDFATEEIRPLRCDFAAMGLVLCLTNTGGSHARLTAEYAAIGNDMKKVAAAYGQDVLRRVDFAEFYKKGFPERGARLRAEHFFEENRRVELMARAMEAVDREACLRLMNMSGRSSEEKLRNIRCPAGDGRLEEGLRLSAGLLEGRGAWRVHGGGFAGCVQALVPAELFPEYAGAMDANFGPGACLKVM